MRAGLGQVAVVTRATLALAPAADHVHRHLLGYSDLATMLADQRLLARDGRFAAVQGPCSPTPGAGGRSGWSPSPTATRWTTCSPACPDERERAQVVPMPQLDHLDRLAQLERALRGNGQWRLPHPWLSTFVGDGRGEDVVASEPDRLVPSDPGPFGQVTVSAVDRGAITAPLLRLPDGELCFAVDLVRIPATAEGADRLVTDNRAAYERVRAAGGTLYPPSALPMSRADWREHFGPAFAGLGAAKRQHDPACVLTPGYEVF